MTLISHNYSNVPLGIVVAEISGKFRFSSVSECIKIIITQECICQNVSKLAFKIVHYFIYTVKPALVTTCIQRPPLFKDHSVMSQLWLYYAFLPLKLNLRIIVCACGCLVRIIVCACGCLVRIIVCVHVN